MEAGQQLALGPGRAGPFEHPVGGEVGAGDVAVEVEQQRPGGGAGAGLGEDLVVQGEQSADPGQQPLPGRGEADAAGGTGEQRLAEQPLQGPDVPAERLLGDVQPFGGPAEVQGLGGRDEAAEQAGVQVTGHGRQINNAD